MSNGAKVRLGANAIGRLTFHINVDKAGSYAIAAHYSSIGFDSTPRLFVNHAALLPAAPPLPSPTMPQGLPAFATWARAAMASASCSQQLPRSSQARTSLKWQVAPTLSISTTSRSLPNSSGWIAFRLTH